jgi:Protein of unknown function (DUF1064)
MPGIVRVAARHKYRAKPTTIDGVRFDSKAEARRWGELLLLQRAGKITDLNIQQRFPLRADNGQVTGPVIGHYVADFTYSEEGRFIVEDCKGFRTPLFKWKAKHFEAQYGYPIRETGKR